VDRYVTRVVDSGLRGQVVVIGPVKNAADIEKKLGVDLAGYARGYNADDLAHAINRHGSDPTPITKADLASYYRWASETPILMATPVSKGGKTARVSYSVKEGGKTFLVTETILPRAKLIALKTMRVRK